MENTWACQSVCVAWRAGFRKILESRQFASRARIWHSNVWTQRPQCVSPIGCPARKSTSSLYAIQCGDLMVSTLVVKHHIMITRSFPRIDRPYLQIDMYDVKHGVNFVLYLNLIEEMVRNHGGVMIAGTREMFRFRGVRMPMFILIYQWEHLTQAECYNREVEQILRESGSSCSTRVLFEMDAHCSRY